MLVADAQREIRQAYIGGFVGQLVSGVLWLTSAGLATWGSSGAAITLLVIGGMFIFPATLLGLRFVRRRGTVSPGNPLNALGMQVALVLPLSLPVVGAATLYRLDWFFPAFMVVVGAHYLPFVFLYGMRMFGVLCGILVAGGILLALYGPPILAVGAWITGAILLGFAVLGRRIVDKELAQD